MSFFRIIQHYQDLAKVKDRPLDLHHVLLVKLHEAVQESQYQMDSKLHQDDLDGRIADLCHAAEEIPLATAMLKSYIIPQ